MGDFKEMVRTKVMGYDFDYLFFGFPNQKKRNENKAEF